jgi:hypothetical protein
MSICVFNIDKREARIITDTAKFAFDGERTVSAGFMSKIAFLPHLGAAIFVAGALGFADDLAATIQRAPLLDFDDLAETMRGIIAATFSTARDRAAAGIAPPVAIDQTILLFGFSAKRERPRALFLHHPEFKAVVIEQPGTYVYPNHTRDPLPQAFTDPKAGLAKIALAQYEAYAARDVALDQPPNLGGRMIYTTVSAAGIHTSQLSQRYPNFVATRRALEQSPERREFREMLQENAEAWLEEAKAADVPSPRSTVYGKAAA